MFITRYFSRSRSARISIPVLTRVLLCLTLALTIGTAEAQLFWKKKPAPSITIKAPEPIKSLLETHFQAPTAPPADEIARAAFERRAHREIRELLATEGYFNPTIKVLPARPDKPPALEVNPGPQTLVAELTIEFMGDLAIKEPGRLARIEKLRAAWPLRAGQPFRSLAWQEAKALLLSSVTSEEYPAAKLEESRAEVDAASSQARLWITVNSGPAFRYGPLIIKGLNRYDESLIRGLAPFKAGDSYKRDQLLAFQTKLQNMAQFSSAVVHIETDPAAHQAAPLEVVLSEAQTQRVSVGVGYSSNTGARGEINYSNNNLLNDALRFNSILRLEQKRQALASTLDSVPNQAGRWFSLGGTAERTSIQNLETIRGKVGLSRNQILGNTETRLALNWQREDRNPEGGVHQVNQTLALDGYLRYRSVDNPLFPRDGSVSELRLGGGSKQVLSDQDFVRTYARHQFWYPVGDRHVLFLRGELGYTFAPSRFGIPQEYLFRAGGIQSVRGYPFQSLGVQEGSAVVGGRVLATATVEYNHWLTQNWGAAIFTDVGDAADSWQRLDPVVGYGGGIRWRSPVGPLALDLARGHRDGKLRMHFSIAVAF
jgi:translocation and assembly module TamA